MITTSPNCDLGTTTISLTDKTVNVPNNADLKALIDAYNLDQSDEKMAKVVAKLDEIQDVNRIEYWVDDKIKFYVNKDLYFFVDDTSDQYPLTEETVINLAVIAENGGNVDPIINFLKLLRRNPKYTPEFAEDAISVLFSTFNDNKIYNTLVDKGFYNEVAYIQAKTNLFTLTDTGLIVAYKRADFKRHKFNTTTGEMIPRFPFVYDEETGDQIFTYPETAEDFKIYLDSKTINNMATRNENNKYITVGSVIDQRKGQPGFEKDEVSLIFKGTKVTKNDDDIYVQVLIHPAYINKVSDKFNSISTPVYYVTKFSFKKSLAEIKPAKFISYANADWKKTVADNKKKAEENNKKALAIISSQENL